MITEPGQLLSGKFIYRIVEVIHREPDSVLCLARMQKSGQLVAIRLLEEHAGKRFSAQFQREMVLLNEIASCYIPRILDYGSADGHFFVVVENVEGLLLSQVLADAPGGRLEEPVAFTYLEQLAEALTEIGRHGIVHGEIRPQNIVVTPEGSIKLLGFATNQEVCLGGTPNYDLQAALPYAAPEMLQVGHPAIDIRADIYSLGAVAYEMLTGHPPFEGHDLSELVYMIVMDTRPPASSFTPNLSAGVDHFLGRCMAKDPDERFQTPNDILLGIRALELPAEPLPPPSEPAPRRLPRAMLVSAQGTRYMLPNEGGILGRADGAQPGLVAVDLSREEHGRTVSRRQAQLQRVQGQWVISPYPNTTNTLLLNGAPLRAGATYPMKRGDELRIGGVKLMMQLEETIAADGAGK